MVRVFYKPHRAWMDRALGIYDYARMTPSHDETLQAITARLILLRKAIAGDDHGSQAKFAALTGIATNAWNNLEKGRNRISVDTALTLAKTIGVTLDWIYRGGDNEYRLPGDILEKFRQVRGSEQPKPSKMKA